MEQVQESRPKSAEQVECNICAGNERLDLEANLADQFLNLSTTTKYDGGRRGGGEGRKRKQKSIGNQIIISPFRELKIKKKMIEV